MPKLFIAEHEANQEIASLFAATEKQLRTARNGTVYLDLKLVDKTGEISGKMWEKAAEASGHSGGWNCLFAGKNGTLQGQTATQHFRNNACSRRGIRSCRFSARLPFRQGLPFRKIGQALVRGGERPSSPPVRRRSWPTRQSRPALNLLRRPSRCTMPILAGFWNILFRLSRSYTESATITRTLTATCS